MNVLFEFYKDKCIGNSEIFRKEVTSKYKLTDDEVTELYRNIVNYQIKKYGATLDGKYYEEVDIHRAKIRHQQRGYDRKRRRGIK